MRLTLLLCFAWLLAGCAADPPAGATDPTLPPTIPAATSPTVAATAVPTRSPGATAATEPDASSPTLEPTTAPTAGREATAAELAQTAPPFRDDVRLAVAFRGADPAAATSLAPVEPELGATERFNVSNVDSNTVSTITAELMGIGEHAYFWFDLGPDSTRPDEAGIAEAVKTFDDIYQTLHDQLGLEPDGRQAHIVHASPRALCDEVEACGLAGYFSTQDLLPRAINPQSNERLMFIMNAWQYGSGNYFDVLAHELRHLLGANYDEGEEDWAVEGGAMLAEDLVGYINVPQARGSLFLGNPDQQLNSWTDGFTAPYYGQGYLVSRFIYDRLGEALYHQFITDPAPGLRAIDSVAAANGLALTGEQLWLDWLVSMAIHDDPAAPERYRWGGPELGPLLTAPVNNLPTTFDTTVNQYAADYYELPSSGTVRIEFAGAPTVSLLRTNAPSGEHFWYAQRANTSNPRLTRPVDLRQVDAATLEYRVYTDIERGYDFAYVSVSTDGGQRWQPLVADGMQGLDPADDPSSVALADRFYSSRRGEWFAERIDLSPYAGQEVLLRFEMVTDLIQTWGGFAIDDIAIPEIGFFDDAERHDAERRDAGWTAEGFTRATADLPQRWPLQLVTFGADGQPTVTPLTVSDDGRLSHTYMATPGSRRPLLIVAAVAPDTLTPAPYTLAIDSP
jgi:hypothetical protein